MCQVTIKPGATCVCTPTNRAHRYEQKHSPISMSHMPKKQAPRSQSKWDKAWTNLSPDAEWVIHRFIQRFKG